MHISSRRVITNNIDKTRTPTNQIKSEPKIKVLNLNHGNRRGHHNK